MTLITFAWITVAITAFFLGYILSSKTWASKYASLQKSVRLMDNLMKKQTKDHEAEMEYVRKVARER